MEGGLMKTIITIQHTQSVHHTNGMVGSWTDWELSELGVRQAKRIGERLKMSWPKKGLSCIPLICCGKTDG